MKYFVPRGRIIIGLSRTKRRIILSEHKDRGRWNTKLGFVLAAAGSAVGLGNIWGFPTQVADNGGASFILIYIICCLAVGLPVMMLSSQSGVIPAETLWVRSKNSATAGFRH